MGPANCGVVGLYNSMKKFKKQKEPKCEIHDVLIKDSVCICNPSYRLHKFPSVLRNSEKRGKWTGQLR